MTPQDLPEPDVARVRTYCAGRIPERDRQRVRVECEVSSQYVTITEYRAPWDPGSGVEWTRNPIARLDYSDSTQTWQLYYRDRGTRFHEYPRLAPSAKIDNLLAEIDRNPGRVFWR